MNSLNEIISNKAQELFFVTQNFSHSAAQTLTESEKGSSDTDELKKIIYQMREQLESLINILENKQAKPNFSSFPVSFQTSAQTKIIDGVFNGEKMVDGDGNEYLVPPNYASKSKIVEGDLLKLTITQNGSFIFKQIGPIERKRLSGTLMNEAGQWIVCSNNRNYKILKASVTFYKGNIGDETVILVPKDGQSDWAAIETILK